MNTESRETNSIRNLTIGIFNQIIILLLNLVATTFFVKNLGAEYLGLNGLFANLFVLLSFAEFGVGTVMVYSLYKPISKHDIDKITRIYRYFEKIYIFIAILISVIGILLIPILKYILDSDIEMKKIIVYYCMFLISKVITTLYTYKARIITADQKRYIVDLYHFIFEAITVIFQIIYLVLTANFIHYLLFIVGKRIILYIVISRKVRKMYPFLYKNTNQTGIFESEKELILNRIKDVFVYKFAKSLQIGTDNIIISVLVGTVYVGFYANYYAIVGGITSIVDTVFTAITASIGNLIASEKVENQYKVFKITEVVNYWLVGFTSTCLYILLQDFIILWLGEKYLLDWKVTVIIVINYYIFTIRQTVSIFRVASGMFKKVKITVSLAAILNIILSILLGRIYGIFGIFLATTISTLSTYFWFEAKLLMENKFGLSLKHYFKGQVESLVYVGLSIMITSFFVSFVSGITIKSFMMKMITCVVVPNIFYLFVFWRKKEFHYVLIMFYRYFKNLFSGENNG